MLPILIRIGIVDFVHRLISFAHSQTGKTHDHTCNMYLHNLFLSLPYYYLLLSSMQSNFQLFKCKIWLFFRIGRKKFMHMHIIHLENDKHHYQCNTNTQQYITFLSLFVGVNFTILIYNTMVTLVELCIQYVHMFLLLVRKRCRCSRSVHSAFYLICLQLQAFKTCYGFLNYCFPLPVCLSYLLFMNL